ncbi:uncharacterized protein BYT42DRAFT_33904 [Radiomyces spectabilis]|uniref:uncharacterized protein n=1 Tax=Radiomyces spectabilis TaxID=64574 RepID=UPI0022211780|nr:uncharacterized protein BYT42DRAFT_33904 [Radiomyces spectabilis]KAI8394181.1 hypothetical protein BYT42DRAFT_33904 [Radiomyces spectabilis]
MECGEWNPTPTFGSIVNEINPFEVQFQGSRPTSKSDPVTPPSANATKKHLLVSPPQHPTEPPLTPPSPLSISPSDTMMDGSVSQSQPPADQSHQPSVSSTSMFRRGSVKRQSESKESSAEPANHSGGRKRRIIFEGEDAEDERKKFLERNRVAASKCRQKKKKWMQELEQRSEQVANRNKELHDLVSQLREETMYLRNQLLAHGNCDCTVVQSYLRKTSAQITSSVASAAAESTTTVPVPPTTNHNFSNMVKAPEQSTGWTPFINQAAMKADYFSQTTLPEAATQSTC